MWKLNFGLSLACLPLALLLSLILNHGRAQKKRVNPFHLLFVGAFLAAFLLFLPIRIGNIEAAPLHYFRSALLSFLSSIQVLTSGSDFSTVTEAMVFCPKELQEAYQTWFLLIYSIAPIMTFGFILSLFKNVSAYLRFYRLYFRELFVFSELNERALTLAADLKRKNKTCGIVFMDAEERNALAAEAKQLGAVSFQKDFQALNFRRHSSRKNLFFFLISENETKSLNQALSLIDSYREIENCHVYVFSTKVESELLLTSVPKGKIKLRRINETQSLINRLLYERGELLFQSAKPENDGTKHINAVIVGMGKHGTQMIKALSWYGQMDGYRLRVTAFDRDPLAKECFVAIAPELMDSRYNGVIIDGEAQYTIDIHPGTPVETASFAEQIARLSDTTYVLVALGNDNANIQTAVMLRMYFERLHIHPVIQAIVYNTQQKDALQGIRNYRGQAYDIDFIGDLDSSYAEEVIIDSELEADALRRHLKWGTEDEFWAYEYNYRSSTASAIHMRARKLCGIAGAEKSENELTAEEKLRLQQLEHRRWNAYMRSEGYVFSGSKEKSSRNDLGKMHHDLVDFDSLSAQEKEKDSRVGTV